MASLLCTHLTSVLCFWLRTYIQFKTQRRGHMASSWCTYSGDCSQAEFKWMLLRAVQTEQNYSTTVVQVRWQIYIYFYDSGWLWFAENELQQVWLWPQVRLVYFFNSSCSWSISSHISVLTVSGKLLPCTRWTLVLVEMQVVVFLFFIYCSFNLLFHRASESECSISQNCDRRCEGHLV